MKDFFKHNGILILIIALLLAAITFVVSLFFGGTANPVSNLLGVITTPVRDGINAIATWAEDLYTSAFETDMIREENERLKQENARLQEEAREGQAAARETWRWPAAAMRGRNSDGEGRRWPRAHVMRGVEARLGPRGPDPGPRAWRGGRGAGGRGGTP